MWILFAGYNLVVLLVYGWDKRAAKRHAWRIPEATLLWLAAIGGGVGALVGMLLWHHKTRKSRFAFGVPLLLIVQAGALWWGYRQGWVSIGV
jgi:uncharacterized membrane protein YsdA (DUF1294 family)